MKQSRKGVFSSRVAAVLEKPPGHEEEAGHVFYLFRSNKLN